MAVDLMDLAKAFAGPVATIIAASTAAWITYRLGREQVRIAAAQATTAAAQAATAAAQEEIAKSQRDIAYDKLKWDLFGKRYEIIRWPASSLTTSVAALSTGCPEAQRSWECSVNWTRHDFSTL